MAESAGTNGRALEVLNFLASRPTETFTLSEIAGHLGLSNGSAHRVLSALTRARYLSRHPKHKTYSLGVVLVAVGQAALERHRGVEIARREIATLAQELKAQCLLTTIVDDEMIFLVREGAPKTDEALYRVGERRPFLPPLGLVQIAWCPAAQAAAYLDEAAGLLSPQVLAHLQLALRSVRERGYAMARKGKTLRALSRTAPLPLGREREADCWQGVKALIPALTEAEIYLLDASLSGEEGIAYISAPVFSPEGSVAYEITLSGLPDNLAPADIERYAKRVCAAANVVTSETYGRVPVAG